VISTGASLWHTTWTRSSTDRIAGLAPRMLLMGEELSVVRRLLGGATLAISASTEAKLYTPYRMSSFDKPYLI
jgi:hypothetical protein